MINRQPVSAGGWKGMSVCVVYRELLEEGKHILAQAEIVDAECDAWLLLEHVSGMSRAQFFLHQQDTVPDELEADYRGMLRKRAEHIPLQHLTGTQEFMGLEFQVSPDVLIPRQDTELLVEKLLPHVQGKRVLDVCTGSGCIAISLAVSWKAGADGCGGSFRKSTYPGRKECKEAWSGRFVLPE